MDTPSATISPLSFMIIHAHIQFIIILLSVLSLSLSSCWGAAAIYLVFLVLSGTFIGVNVWRKKQK